MEGRCFPLSPGGRGGEGEVQGERRSRLPSHAGRRPVLPGEAPLDVIPKKVGIQAPYATEILLPRPK